MERLAVPWLFVGPSGSGKLTEARSTIERALSTPITLPLETKILPIGDGYEARIFTSPHHFEIDIPTLSMQDKQIIAELLATFFASTDVFPANSSSCAAPTPSAFRRRYGSVPFFTNTSFLPTPSV